MKNIDKYRLRTCIIMDLDDYDELINKITDNKVSVYLDYCDNELTYETVDGNSDIDFIDTVALSKYFDTTVTSVHADSFDLPYVWIVYKED